MAGNIVDIIQRLDFEVNDAQLQNVTAELDTQLDAINVYQKRINNLEATLAKSSANDIKRREKITQLINQNKTAIDNTTKSMLTMIQTNDKLAASIQRGAQQTGTYRNAAFALTQVLREAPAFAFSFQTGLLAISNNLPILTDQFKLLKAETGSSTAALAALGRSIFSMTNLLTIGITVLTVFGDDIVKAFTKASDAIDETKDRLDSFSQSVKTLSDNTRLLSDNLSNQYDVQIAQLRAIGASEEEITKATLDGIDKRYIANQKYIIQLKQQLAQQKAYAAELAGTGTDEQFENARKRALETEDEIRRAAALSASLKTQYLVTYYNAEGRKLEESKQKNKQKNKEEAEDAVQLRRNLFETIQAFQDLQDEEARNAPKPVEVGDLSLTTEDKKNIQEDIRYYIQAYTQATQTIAQLVQSIFAVQAMELDRQIQVQTERVNQALQLAERGNVEAYQAERERLEDLQQKREEIAQRQIQINAALQASNAAIAAAQALQVVTNAGATGDPYSTAARIAAAVAALAAGFSFVRNLVTATRGFADGGYTGDGGKYEPAGVVHKGEFVMDKANTSKYRNVLEAMHSGKFPIMSSNQVMQMQVKGLEKRLDSVIELLGDNGVNVSQVIDGYGVQQVVQTHMRRERNRWR